jgi:adenine-specific DNA-methyltransferase
MKTKLPKTRYYGSKRKLIPWIWECIEKEKLEFNSVLDLFGGSGVFSYSAKLQEKEVFYNDIFKFNYHIGRALIENNDIKVSSSDINYLFTKHNSIKYQFKIANFFKDIYYPDKENKQIDIICQNILNINDVLKKSLFFYLLFQSCMIKRPFNIFHRKNLNLRLNNVHRNFGNKKTWEIPFRDLFVRFSNEINEFIFDNGKKNISYNYSALDCPINADLVYIDPPYMNQKKNHTTYLSRYHFLEGLSNYENFTDNINFNKKNLEITINSNLDFESRDTFFENLQKLILRYRSSIIVISYRKNGVPSINELLLFIKTLKKNVNIYNNKYSYALRRNNFEQEEVLIIIS